MKKEIRYEYQEYENVYYLTLKRRRKVNDIENGDELGYSNASGDIFIASSHPVFSKLPKKERRFFRCGVFVHELMHQVFSNFRLLSKTLRDIENPFEKEIFATINNVLEDPAIENFAPRAIGPLYLKALRFTIMKIYASSEPIDKATSPFSQLMSALIQFGDVGPIKGEFTFPEAKEYFKKIAPKFYEGINEIDAEKRNDIAKYIFETTRPLWQKMVDEQTEEFEQFRKLMQELGKHMKSFPFTGPDEKSSDSSGDSGDDSSGESSKKNEMRKNVMASLGAGNPSGDSSSEKNTEEGSSNGNSGDSKNDDENSESKETEKALSELKKDSEKIDEESKELEKAIKGNEEKDKKKDKECDISPLECDSSENGRKLSNNNKVIKGKSEDAEEYLAIVKRYLSKIKSTANKFSQIFEFDKDEKCHKNTGKVNLVRATTTKSSRVFDKNYTSNNFSDTAVFLLIDESGSMCGERIRYARETAIALTEIFSRVNIPIYVMGFTADWGGADIYHTHYIGWNNSVKKQRYGLININACANNRDGASIRYATQILKKRPASNKMLIVISDGKPAASGYYGDFGDNDTKKAIEEARKNNIKVLGVAIGSDKEILHTFYKNDFIAVESVDTMFSAITKKLKKIFRNEE